MEIIFFGMLIFAIVLLYMFMRVFILHVALFLNSVILTMMDVIAERFTRRI